MDGPQYTSLELKVMQLMAHGCTREQISQRVHGPNGRLISPSTVARTARSATDKAVPTPEMNAPIIHGVAVLVAQGRISVKFADQRPTAQETALAWLDTKIHSCLNWREFEELRSAYTALRSEMTNPGGEVRRG